MSLPQNIAAKKGHQSLQPDPGLFSTQAADDDETAGLFGERDTTIKSGWLYKKGGPAKTWKKRWFVLRKEHFAFYEDSTEYETKQIVRVDSISGISSKPGKKRTGISLYVGTREVHLEAETEEEANSWVTALKSAVKLPTPLNSLSNSPLDFKPSSPRKINASFDRRGRLPLSTSIQFASSVESSSFMSPPILPKSTNSLPVSDDGYLTPGFSDLSTAEEDLSPTSDTQSPHRGQNLAKTISNASDRVIMQSYLKRHHVSQARRSKKIWAVLRPHGLSLYPDHNEYRALKVVSFKDIIDANDIESDNKSSKRRPEWRFQVITKEKALRFSVDREDLLDEWVGALKSRIDRQEARRSTG